MADMKIVTASLEGAQVLLDGEQCRLQEYDFEANRWQPKDEATWPLTRQQAEEWVAGWNPVDRFVAMNLLTRLPDEP